MCFKSRTTGNPQAEPKLLAEVLFYHSNITATKTRWECDWTKHLIIRIQLYRISWKKV